MLNEQTLLSYNEVNKIIANVGKTQSQGFELTINTTNIRNKDFEWTSDLTFSLYRDKWKERDPKWNRMLMMSITDGCVTIPVICQMVWFK